MYAKKILLSTVCLVAMANAAIWEDKYNDILAKAEQATSKSEKDAFLQQAKEYEKAKNAELNVQKANENLILKQNDYDLALKDYNSLDTDFNQTKQKLNTKQNELSTHTNDVNDFNAKIQELTLGNENYEKLKKDYELHNTKLEENIKKSQTDIATIDNDIATKQKEGEALKATLAEKQKTREEARKAYHDASDKYNTALDTAESMINTCIEQARQEMKKTHDAFIKASNDYELENKKLEDINSNIQNLNSQKTTISTNISNMEAEIQNNTTKMTSFDNEMTKNTKAIEDSQAKITEIKTKIESISKELETLLSDTNTKQELLEQKLNELNASKTDLENSQKNLENTKKTLDKIVFGINEKQIKQTIGTQFANSASGELNDLVMLMGKNPDLSNPSEKTKVQTVANKVAGAIIKKEKNNTLANSNSATLVQLNNMTKRLGEIRGFDAKVGTWIRGYGGRYSSKDSHFYYHSTQLGADNKVDIGSNSTLLIGGLLGFDKINGDFDTKSYSVGGYLSYLLDNGVFADFVLKYVNTSHEKQDHDIKSQNSFLASFELGHRLYIYDFYVEPSLELISGYVSEYKDKYAKSTTTIKAYSPLLFKPQVFVGGGSDSFIYRAGVGAVIDTSNQKASISIDEIVSGINAKANTKLDKNNHGFASIGASYKASNDLMLNLGFERSFGGKLTNDYEVNATIRYGF